MYPEPRKYGSIVHVRPCRGSPVASNCRRFSAFDPRIRHLSQWESLAVFVRIPYSALANKFELAILRWLENRVNKKVKEPQGGLRD